MELSRYVDDLQRELAVAAEAGGEEGRELAERLAVQLSSSIKLTLLTALSAAADEITRELAPGSVEIRLRGLDPTFVVTLPAEGAVHDYEDDAEFADAGLPSLPAPVVPEGASGDTGVTSRINFRPPEYLKVRIEEAAGHERLSVNAWLVRAVSAILESEDHDRRPERRAPRRVSRRAERYTGWVT
ncbi:hypothetical protein ACFWF7_21740 [Nocardia sp. NPDC060256]|uniref:hypothetical protein n=1 Tax=unclassified Nocardia TaxID=2637762 RepID=UPI003663C9C8